MYPNSLRNSQQKINAGNNYPIKNGRKATNAVIAAMRYYNGKQAGTRICSKCKYSESATARTLFHMLKFPIRKAFHFIYTMSCNKKGISSYELSRQLSLRQKTCWFFQRKVQEAMRTSGE